MGRQMHKSGNNARRRGVVLLLVLWMVIIVGLIALAYASSVRTQLQVERFARLEAPRAVNGLSRGLDGAG